MNLCTKCGALYKRRLAPTPDLCAICSFWERVEIKDTDDCWLWQGTINANGYGRTYVKLQDGTIERNSHRVSWSLNNGPIDDNMFVLHCCDDRYPVGDITNRRCVNPGHLRLGTQADNVEDRRRTGRGNAPRGDNHGSRLHPEKLNPAHGDSNGARKHPEKIKKGSVHYRSKLTEDIVREIRRSSETNERLADRYNVPRGAIYKARSGINWRHVT